MNYNDVQQINNERNVSNVNNVSNNNVNNNVQNVNDVNVNNNVQNNVNGNNINEMRFSLFGAGINTQRSLTPHIKEATLGDAYRWMNTMRMKELTDKLRSITDPQQRKLFKATSLPFATFSGVFSRRNAESLVRHSTMMCFDFDHLGNERTITETKLLLAKDPYFETLLAFTSPSGDGLKWVTHVDLQRATHEKWYRAIRHYLATQYHLTADPAPSSVAAACFLSFDPTMTFREDIAAF